MSSPFSLGPGLSTSVLDFTDSSAVKLYNKAISPLDLKFDEEAHNLAVFLASVKDHYNFFNWSNLISIPFADTATRNLLTHYGQVILSNRTDHGLSYVSTQKRNVPSMTCCTISWLTLWNPSSGPRFFYMLRVNLQTVFWLPLLFSSRSSY